MMSVVSDSVTQPYALGLNVSWLPDNTAKSRFGVAYVRAVCSQAGVGFGETSPDEDLLAVDAEVKFREANAHVQIKCTSQYNLDQTPLRWSVTPEWRRKWEACLLPVYFVLVVLDTPARADWLTHPLDGTMYRAAAYWTRVNGTISSPSVQLERTRRLTIDTMNHWSLDVRACFNPDTTETEGK